MVTKHENRMAQRAEFYPKLESLIKRIGVWNVNCLTLSKEWRTPHRTVLNWKKEILKKMPQPDPSKVGDNLFNMLESTSKQLQMDFHSATEADDKVKIARAMAILAEKLTLIMEKYGLKAMVAEKLDMEVDVTSTNPKVLGWLRESFKALSEERKKAKQNEPNMGATTGHAVDKGQLRPNV